MAHRGATGECYTIRRQVMRFFGAGFDVYDAQGRLVAHCNQKAFRLREDLRLYTDKSRSSELLRIQARQMLDFGATYDVALPSGDSLGSLRRKGLKSIVRDEWLLYDPTGAEIARLREDSGGLALARRLVPFVSVLCPQRFHLCRSDGTSIATYRTHFNPFVYRLGIAIHERETQLDDLMLLATGCLIAAIEGRQDGGNAAGIGGD